MNAISDLREKINSEINKLDFDKDPVELYEPIRYILELGGKRIRPVLALLACEMFGGKIETAINPAIGIEVFHNFTLLHDDIMDNAPIRRGKPTVHEKWEKNIAILSGDTMMALAYEFILKSPENQKSEVFSIFNKTAIEVCEGQQYDMNFETLENVSIDEYINMIRLKTAVLLAASLKIGAILGNAETYDTNKLYSFGEKIGIAFQLKDDLLDVFSIEKKFGKKTGGDIIENKKTYLYLKAFELAEGKTLDSLHYFFNTDFNNNTEKVNGVLGIYEKLNIKEITEREIQNYYQSALSILDEIKIDDSKKTELRNYVNKLSDRES